MLGPEQPVNEGTLLAILVRFATTLTVDFSIQDVLDRLAEQLVALLPVTGAGVLLMDGPTEDHFVSTTDERIRSVGRLQVELGEGPCLTAFRSGTEVALPDLGADRTMPRFSARAAATGLGAVFSFPLRHLGACIGALELYATEPTTLSDDQLASSQTIADVIASYLMIARRREETARTTARLTEDAMHDPLTGLPNRRLLTDRLDQATSRSERTGRPFAVLFCDIDGFKQVNDEHGHGVGDQLLIDVAARLSASLRPQDTLARFAGDEFVIVCEDLPDEDEATDLAARTLLALSQPFRMVATGEAVELAMSVGVAVAGGGFATADDAVELADAAMYRAKSLGGGRHVRLPGPAVGVPPQRTNPSRG
ncbi:sensor domain-containing diguanylate cyclase [Nitriliruptor alkaliphilus]|uniref:sensor domain-containing diguanylate cyclase n=1 Tax=Nitriliruptor alkaliphilus TaxID=427918 RepID=UPI000695E9FF|nr:sensor domain-containing diguanylate cyclase [Nitriliruptor alkaliphilus]